MTAGIYGFFGTVLVVSCIASFMSTADSFILAMANQMTEDFWVGWLQKYVPENAVGGKNMQALIVGKLCSLFCLVTSVCMALYTDYDFFTLLNYSFCSLWSLAVPMWLGTTFFPQIKSPPIILTGLVVFPLSIWYEEAVYIDQDGFGNGYPTSAGFAAMVTALVLLVTMGVMNAIFPDFNDHTNKMFMGWDAIGTELDRFGITPKREGSRMLCKINGQWKTVQVKVPQARDSTSVVCDVLDANGTVAQSGRRILVSELKGIPHDPERRLWDDVMKGLRPYLDTPVGTLCFILKPLIFFYAVPMYEEAGSMVDSDQIHGVGLPRWAVRYVLANGCTSTIMVFENWLLWRGCDSNGKSICATDADLWGKMTGVLDLKWSEIFKYGCRRRKTWVLETLSAKQVGEWAAELPDGIQQYATLFTKQRIDGYGLNKLAQVSPDAAARQLSDLGVQTLGDCFSLLREIDNLKLQAEQQLYKTDQYLPPPGTVPFSARNSRTVERETLDEISNPLSDGKYLRTL